MDEYLLELLKNPKYKELVDNIDTIIVFQNGKWKESIHKEDLGRINKNGRSKQVGDPIFDDVTV